MENERIPDKSCFIHPPRIKTFICLLKRRGFRKLKWVLFPVSRRSLDVQRMFTKGLYIRMQTVIVVVPSPNLVSIWHDIFTVLYYFIITIVPYQPKHCNYPDYGYYYYSINSSFFLSRYILIIRIHRDVNLIIFKLRLRLFNTYHLESRWCNFYQF